MALASDQNGGSGPKFDLPPPSKAGALEAPESPSTAKANGHAPEADPDDEWARVGWAPRFGMPGSENQEEEASLLDHQTWLEGKLEDKFFGD